VLEDLYFTYKGQSSLKNVDLTFTFFMEDGAKPSMKRFWLDWAPNEKKTVNYKGWRKGKGQRVDVDGTAEIGTEEVVIGTSFSLLAKPAK